MILGNGPTESSDEVADKLVEFPQTVSTVTWWSCDKTEL